MEYNEKVVKAQKMRLIFVYCVGEFGVVYRAKLLRKQGRSKPELVAVKTMRGTFELETTSACGLTVRYIIASLISSSNVNFFKRINIKRIM